MRHEADDVACRIADAGDVVERAVWIVTGMLKDHLAVGFERVQVIRIREVVALAMRDRQPQQLSRAGTPR